MAGKIRSSRNQRSQKSMKGFGVVCCKDKTILVCKGKPLPALSQVHFSFQDLSAPAQEEEPLGSHSSYASQDSGDHHVWLVST